MYYPIQPFSEALTEYTAEEFAYYIGRYFTKEIPVPGGDPQTVDNSLGYTDEQALDFAARYAQVEDTGIYNTANPGEPPQYVLTILEMTKIKEYFHVSDMGLQLMPIRDIYAPIEELNRGITEMSRLQWEMTITDGGMSYLLKMPIARYLSFKAGIPSPPATEDEEDLLEDFFIPYTYAFLVSYLTIAQGTITALPFFSKKVYPVSIATYDFALRRWSDNKLEQGYRANPGGAKGAFLFYDTSTWNTFSAGILDWLQFFLFVTRKPGGTPGTADLRVYGHPYTAQPEHPDANDLVFYGVIPLDEGENTGNPGYNLFNFANFESDLIAGDIKGLAFYAKSNIERYGEFEPGGYREFDPDNDNIFIDPDELIRIIAFYDANP